MVKDLGWVKLHRKLMDKGYYKKSEIVHLWVHILLKANHKPNEFYWNKENIKVGRGQFITGRKALSEETGINESSIERILKMLENEQQIEQQKTTKFRLITVKNWDYYQTSETSEQQNEQQVNNKRTTSEQQVNTNKNDNNVKNDNNIPKGMDTPTYGNKDLISLKKFLINNYPKPLVGITDTRKLQNIRQVSTRRKNQDEWMEDNWKENIKNFLSLYIERTPEEYLVNSIDKLRERIKLWREYRGKLN